MWLNNGLNWKEMEAQRWAPVDLAGCVTAMGYFEAFINGRMPRKPENCFGTYRHSSR